MSGRGGRGLTINGNERDDLTHPAVQRWTVRRWEIIVLTDAFHSSHWFVLNLRACDEIRLTVLTDQFCLIAFISTAALSSYLPVTSFCVSFIQAALFPGVGCGATPALSPLALKSKELPSSPHPPLPSGSWAWHPTVTCGLTWLHFMWSGCLFFSFVFYSGGSFRERAFVMLCWSCIIHQRPSRKCYLVKHVFCFFLQSRKQKQTEIHFVLCEWRGKHSSSSLDWFLCWPQLLSSKSFTTLCNQDRWEDLYMVHLDFKNNKVCVMRWSFSPVL